MRPSSARLWSSRPRRRRCSASSSPGNLAPVFDAILEKAHRLCRATQGTLQLYDGTHFRAVATHGLRPDWAEARYRPRLPTNAADDELLAGARLSSTIPTAALAEETRLADALRRGDRGSDGPRVPFRREGTLLGYISAYREEVKPFSAQEITLLESFAQQAAIAIENARLINETREACWTSRPRPRRCCRSSTPRPAISRRCSMPCSTGRCGCAARHLGPSDALCRTAPGSRTVVVCAMSPEMAYAEVMQHGRVLRPRSRHRRVGLAALVRNGEKVRADRRHDGVGGLSGSEIPLPTCSRRRGRMAAPASACRSLRGETALHGALVLYRPEVRAFADREVALLAAPSRTKRSSRWRTPGS